MEATTVMRQRIDARIRTVGIAAFVALTVFNGGAIAANLNVTVDNIKKPKGKIVIALFDSKDSFLVEPVAEFSLDISEDGEAVAGFPDLAPGTYAIAAYHDKNDDGKLNTFLGVPREDYGFSNNARSMFGPPSFKKAAFEVNGYDLELEFRVR